MEFRWDLLYKECCKEKPDIYFIKSMIEDLFQKGRDIYGMSQEDLFRCLRFFSGPYLYEYNESENEEEDLDINKLRSFDVFSASSNFFSNETKKSEQYVKKGLNRYRYFVDESMTNYSREDIIELIQNDDESRGENKEYLLKTSDLIILGFIKLMDITIENKIAIISRLDMRNFIDSLIPAIDSIYYVELFKRLLDYVTLLDQMQGIHNSVSWAEEVLEFLGMEELFQSACENNHIASSICFVLYELVDAYINKKDYHKIKYITESFGKIPKRVTLYQYQENGIQESLRKITSMSNAISMDLDLGDVFFFEFEGSEILFLDMRGYSVISPFLEEDYKQDQDYMAIDLLNEIPQLKERAFINMVVHTDLFISGKMISSANRVFLEFDNEFLLQIESFEVKDKLKKYVEFNIE